MHTIMVIAGGFVLLGLMLLAGRWSGRSVASAALAFVPVWLVASTINMVSALRAPDTHTRKNFRFLLSFLAYPRSQPSRPGALITNARYRSTGAGPSSWPLSSNATVRASNSARAAVQMIGRISQHWQGNNGFWKSLLVFSILIPLIIYFIVLQWVGHWSVLDTPRSRMLQGAIGFSLVGAVAIWQLVGMWRASSASKEPARSWFTRWSARAISAVTAFIGLVMVSAAPGGMAQLHEAATDQDDIGKQGYSVDVDEQTLLINGYMAWGLLDQVNAAFAENPQINTIIMNSPGGHIQVGTRLYDLFRRHGVDTVADGLCGSACTIAFIGGKERILNKGAKLGFHSTGGSGQNLIDAGNQKLIATFREFGASEDFIAQLIATPPEDVWYPDRKQLLASGIVTTARK